MVTFDKQLRNNFMEAKQNEEEVEMRAWVALARKRSRLTGCPCTERIAGWVPVDPVCDHQPSSRKI
jgi:hypothetical protein